MQLIVALVVGLVSFLLLRVFGSHRSSAPAPMPMIFQPPYGASGASAGTPGAPQPPQNWNVQLPNGDIVTAVGSAHEAPPPPPYTVPQSAPAAPGGIEARRGAGHFN